MDGHTIPQRDLRNNVAEVLRAAEAGEVFTITVRGRPVARLGPISGPEPRTDVDRETIRALLRHPLDPGFAADLEDIEEHEDDHWPE